MRASLFVVLALTPTLAAADPAVVRIGAVAGGHVSSTAATLRTRSDGVHATLTVVLASPSRDAREVALRFSVPPGVTATGLALNGTAGEQLSSGEGRQQYEDTVAYQKDPALLEQLAPGRLSLRVYPVRRGEDATVTIELAMPVDASLVVVRAGAARQTFAATEADAAENLVVGSVDAETSLVALPGLHGRRATLASGTARRGWRPHVQTLPSDPTEALVAYNP